MKKTLLIIILVLFIFLLNFRLLVFNLDFYNKEFDKLNIPKEAAQEQTKNLFSYFKNNKELPDFFNEKEKLHLKDVKNLINRTILLFYITLILLPILIYLNRKNLKKPFLISSIISIIIVIFFYIINFQNFFNSTFHKLLFNNDLYILDPAKDNLINLFPYQFFQDFAYKLFLNIFIINVIILITLLVLYRKSILKIFSVILK